MAVKEARRCGWCLSDPLYVDYHDNEWGRPVHDGDALYERLILEGMQAGLSWLTILKKRAHMTEVFFGFDPARLVAQGPRRMAGWLQDPGIIRHRGKLEAMLNNAQLRLQMGNDFSHHLWSFVDGVPVQNDWSSPKAVPAHSLASQAMSRSLKKAGFKFVGPTICYAFMQSVGMVNDHLTSCPSYGICAQVATR
ncbi:MAG: DNA-3-methyladenine glycosylase I [Proteobacteria bacterium]|nr:DNA-3-methyladenine glycosylase I [Pseudomonadota bacterium]